MAKRDIHNDECCFFSKKKYAYEPVAVNCIGFMSCRAFPAQKKPPINIKYAKEMQCW